MKLILAQPAIKRFQWELDVLLTNISQFGDFDVVLLFTRDDDTVPQYLADKYGVQCFVYADKRFDKRYIPSVRPYLLWRYLSDDASREKEQYFYIDSDIIFREWPNLDQLGANAKRWLGADCGTYINYDYIVKCKNGAQIAAKMAEICGITVDQMKGVPGIGAQLLIDQPTADFWERAYDDSIRIYDYLSTIDTDIQRWTAEMWAQLWGMVRDGIEVVATDELAFCRPTDDLSAWDKVKILHNAGVTSSKELFFKGKYVTTTPFGEDFSYINPTKVSMKYVEAIQKVII